MLLMSDSAALQQRRRKRQQQQKGIGEASTVVTIEGHEREEKVDVSGSVEPLRWFTSMLPFQNPTGFGSYPGTRGVIEVERPSL